MEEIYWGVEAELEEQAYQFRRARLADRGFPDYFEAQDVFAYLNPQRFPRDSRRLPRADARRLASTTNWCRRDGAGAGRRRQFAVQRRA